MAKSLVGLRRIAAVAAACLAGSAFPSPADAFQKQMTSSLADESSSGPSSGSDEPAALVSRTAAPPRCEKEPDSTYVVLLIFAGRRDRMSVALSYVDRLIATCKLDEVHIWNTTRTAEDGEWLQTLADKPGYTVFTSAAKWIGAYWYYGGAPPGTPPATAIGKQVPASFQPAWEGADKDNTVLLKSDDDIVYMDIDKLDCFVRYIHSNPQMFIVHANILNNGVADFYKAAMDPDLLERFPQLGEYPQEVESGILDWKPYSVDEPGFEGAEWSNGSLALDLHELFLENPKRFTRRGLHGEECIVYKGPGQQVGQGRLSVNFLGALWSKWDKIGSLVNPNGRISPFDDEWALTAMATLQPGIVECIYTQFVVSHLSFFSQRAFADAALPQYKALLAEQQRGWQQHGDPSVSEC